jgi:hypothetical protein
MEENENNVQNENVESTETVNSTVTESTTVNSKMDAFVEIIKAKKNIIIGVLIVLLVVFLFCKIFVGSPKKEVKSFVSAYNSANVKKMYNKVDWAGYLALKNLDEDDYEDFWDEYKDVKDSDEYEDFKETLEENRDDAIEDLKDELEDLDYKVKVKKIKKVEKVGKNLYKVKAQLKYEEDDDTDTDTFTFYVMKKGLKYYMVGGGAVETLYYYINY